MGTRCVVCLPNPWLPGLPLPYSVLTYPLLLVTKVECASLVIATGGLSFPAVGTDGTGHRIMKGFGLDLKETYPALTPLTGLHPSGTSLAGLSMYNTKISFQAPALPSASKSEQKQPRSTPRTDFLFTHKV